MVQRVFYAFLLRLTNLKNMNETCQNLVYDEIRCTLAFQYLTTCFEKIATSFNDLIQYITSGSHGNNGGSVPPKDVKIFNACLCGNDTQQHISFFICYDTKCTIDIKQPILLGSGLYWKGYCLSEE
jgi:hypothetical protein